MLSNAEAGAAQSEAVRAAVEVLAKVADVRQEETSSPDELDAVLADRDGRDLVVAGGDGSLHAVVSALYARGELGGEAAPVVGLIPLGTGNDFARGQGIPLDPAAAAGVAVAGETRHVDIFVDDDDHVVVNAVHAGIGAEAGRAARRFKPFLGRQGYLLGALRASLKVRADHLRVVADRNMLADGRRRVLQVGVGNGPRVGGGTQLLPGADPTDGLADVMVSFAVNPKERLMYAIRLKSGTHEERHDVKTARASEVQIEGSGFWCNADGELAGPMRFRRWQVRAGVLPMRLPTADQQARVER